MKYRLVKQEEEFDCGIAAFSTLLACFGKEYSLKYLKKLYNYTNEEVNFYMLYLLAKKIGYNAEAFYIEELIAEEKLPYIAQIEIIKGVKHFVVVFEKNNTNLLIGDPARQILSISINKFECIFNGFIFCIKKFPQKNVIQ